MVAFNPYDPRAAFLLGMGGSMLENAGWSPMPRTMGQALGAGLRGGQTSMQNAINMKRVRDQQKLEEGLQAMIADLPPEEQLLARLDPAGYLKMRRGPSPTSPVAKIQADYDAGLISEDVYQAAMDKATTSKPLVQLTQGYTSEMVKKMASGDVEYANELRDQAKSAREAMPSLNRAMRLVESGAFETGALGQAKLTLGRYAKAFGLDPKDYGLGDVASGEQAEALFNRMVMDSLDAFKGALSEKELDYADRASAGIGKSPEANKALIQMSINAADRQRRIYREFRKWRRNYGSPDALNEEGIDFEEFVDRMIEAEGDAVELPPIEPQAPAGEEEPPPETVEAGMGGAGTPAPEPVKITPQTDLTKLSNDELIDADLSGLTASQKRKWLAEMDKRGL